MTKKTNYYFIFAVIMIILASVILVPQEECIITNFCRGLIPKPSDSLPYDIYSDRNCCKIDEATFVKRNNDLWYIKTKNNWYPIDNSFILDYAIEETKSTTDSGQYRLKSEFRTPKIGHTFRAVEAKIISGNPDYIDHVSLTSGIYRHDALSFIYSFKDERQLLPTDYPLHVQAFLWGASLRAFLDMNLTSSSEELLSEYIPGYRIYYNAPLLYIPFPLSNKGYLFSGEILNSFKEITSYVHSQNFYAVLAYIPNDLRRLGKLLACDENGALLSLETKRTPKMRLHLQKLSDGKNYYAASVNYRRRHAKLQMNKTEYSLIMDYSHSSAKCYEIYDEQLFVNLRELLLSLNQ